mmetsp:Transcript_26339/g.63498  ORF Transcript_26339/g.63498 Transcript_26339/m.63498 type:complete len:503 (-) Transcript_26339:48-1556(-)
MVKFDIGAFKYMTKDEFRVLTAVEMGMKNHEIVPTKMICQIAALKRGGAPKIISILHRNKLIFHDAKKYDGYRLTYLGYDYLALRALKARGNITGIGNQLGVGKESDIFNVLDADGKPAVLKIHRLGRVSFRAVKNKRDYLLHRKSASWLYMSRLAALREFAYMKALYNNGFPTPKPIDVNRHCIVMSRVDGIPFSQVRSLGDPGLVYTRMMNLIVRLAEHGLIHCDFNEFNTMINERTHNIIMIDFPQMVSTAHKDAKEYFERDVNCVKVHFERRFKFFPERWPHFSSDVKRQINLDEELEASGYKNDGAFEKYRNAIIGEEIGKATLVGDEDAAVDEEDTKAIHTSGEKQIEKAEESKSGERLQNEMNQDCKEVKDQDSNVTSGIETMDGTKDPISVSLPEQIDQNTNLDDLDMPDLLPEEDLGVGDGEDDENLVEDENPADEKGNHQRRNKGRPRYAVTKRHIRDRLAKGKKKGGGGRSRNVQKGRAKKDLRNRIAAHF